MQITDDAVELEGETLKCNTVVITTGYKPVSDLKEKLETKFQVYIVGDASKPRRILDATEEAYLAANEIGC